MRKKQRAVLCRVVFIVVLYHISYDFSYSSYCSLGPAGQFVLIGILDLTESVTIQGIMIGC